MTIAEEFIAWAYASDLSTIPASQQERATLYFLDSLGVMLVAHRLRAAPFARVAAAMFGAADEATVVGENLRVGAPGAAFANGVLIHALDYDDTHISGLVHASAVTVPPALALGESRRCSGAEVLRAMVIGYEFVGRLGAAASQKFHARGFHATSVCGTLSSALVTALLCRVSRQQAAQALGIAGSFSSGSMEFLATGSATKQLHPGWASMAGVVAACLASEGASGPATILEGKRGLYALFTDAQPDLAVLTGDLGRRWQMEGIAVKPYPACHLMHETLDAVASIRGQFKPEDIASIRVRLPQDSIPIIGAPHYAKVRPRTPYEAKFSVQWSTAALLRDGSVGVNTYDEAMLGRPDIVALSERVFCDLAPGEGPAASAPGDVTITLRNDREVHATSVPAKADLRNRVLTKFNDECGLSSSLTKDVADAVLSIADAPDLSRLFSLLTLASREGTSTRFQGAVS